MIQIVGHCGVMWYAMARSLVKLTKIVTSWGVATQSHQQAVKA